MIKAGAASGFRERKVGVPSAKNVLPKKLNEVTWGGVHFFINQTVQLIFLSFTNSKLYSCFLKFHEHTHTLRDLFICPIIP